MDIMDRPIPSGQKLTYEEFLARCDERNAAEWVDGEVIYLTVSEQHDDIGGFLYSILRFWAERNGSGRVYQEPFQMKTGPDLPGRAPDVFYLKTEHFDRKRRLHLEGPADLVIEVISPDSIGRDRGEKFVEYEAGGVQEYWIIDPLRKQADFYLRAEDGYYHAAPVNSNGLYHSTVLQGLWVDVAWFWSDPLPSLMSVLKAWALV